MFSQAALGRDPESYPGASKDETTSVCDDGLESKKGQLEMELFTLKTSKSVTESSLKTQQSLLKLHRSLAQKYAKTPGATKYVRDMRQKSQGYQKEIQALNKEMRKFNDQIRTTEHELQTIKNKLGASLTSSSRPN